MTLTQQSALLYRISEVATAHLERDGDDQRQLIEELEAIATMATGGLECARGVIELRLSPENVKALEQGQPCLVTFMRLGLGVDGVYELYMRGKTYPTPDMSPEPAVPLAVEARPYDLSPLKGGQS